MAIEMDVQEGLITGTYACAYSYAYRSIMGIGHHPSHPGDRSEALRPHAHHASIWHPKTSTDFTDQALARANIYCIDIDRFTGKQRA